MGTRPELSALMLQGCSAQRREEGIYVAWGSDQISWRTGFEWVASGEARERMQGAPGKSLAMSLAMREGLVCGKRRRKSHVASSL